MQAQCRTDIEAIGPLVEHALWHATSLSGANMLLLKGACVDALQHHWEVLPFLLHLSWNHFLPGWYCILASVYLLLLTCALILSISAG